MKLLVQGPAEVELGAEAGGHGGHALGHLALLPSPAPPTASILFTISQSGLDSIAGISRPAPSPKPGLWLRQAPQWALILPPTLYLE